MKRSIISGTGKYIPQQIRKNDAFLKNVFFSEKKQHIDTPNAVIAEKFRQITGIEERRYADPEITASCMGLEAARKAIEDSGIDPETLDYIIVAHNYGDIKAGEIQSDTVPSLASRIKHRLGIRNPSCVAYDILFGCPGWLQGVIQCDLFSKAGACTKSLVIGTETLSRVIDEHDRDSMIFADGAGAAVLEWQETTADGPGILGTAVRSDTGSELGFIDFGCSYLPGSDTRQRYIKMKGRKVYEYAISQVPAAMKDCLEKSGVKIEDLKKIFIHQANEKMDEVIIKNFYGLYGHSTVPENIMPMSIKWLGNSSVATIPTLYDLVLRNELEPHQLHKGDIILFASVGAGMNINAVCYRY
ncbi:3-oxoacyl-ACP synthase III family protein [Flavihumibacter profundi]|uniref:3-oxoacyl-ACP synthase III family protein n=1 Tax=Flavihumibacter profundi TaxID=2716883 RepID=UPI001CC3C050|nr:3-oxoacyl-[acyl-carrier-protein] synthase III C-terminal domain-containing protein [Flavihumibacter profundi]MBZ5856672.1 ketoacyl-ACP synthase III [Flavihumibacter profundi]